MLRFKNTFASKFRGATESPPKLKGVIFREVLFFDSKPVIIELLDVFSKPVIIDKHLGIFHLENITTSLRFYTPVNFLKMIHSFTWYIEHYRWLETWRVALMRHGTMSGWLMIGTDQKFGPSWQLNCLTQIESQPCLYLRIVPYEWPIPRQIAIFCCLDSNCTFHFSWWN